MMDDLQFYIFFNSISVISRWWVGDNERLCAIEPRVWLTGISVGIYNTLHFYSQNFYVMGQALSGELSLHGQVISLLS